MRTLTRSEDPRIEELLTRTEAANSRTNYEVSSESERKAKEDALCELTHLYTELQNKYPILTK